MAKRTTQPQQPNRKSVSRLERERRMRRYLYIGMGATFALVLLLLAWGLVDTLVLKPSRPIATVGEDVIRAQDYAKLLNYRRYDSQMYLQTLDQQRQMYSATEGQEWLVDYLDSQISEVQQSYSLLPSTVYEQMIRDLVIRQEAARRDISVTEDEVESALQEQFGYDPGAASPPQEPAESDTDEALAVLPSAEITGSETISPTGVLTPTEASATPTPYPTEVPMTAEEYEERQALFFETIEDEVGFSRSEFLRLIESSLLQDKVEQALKAEMATATEQVHARHILVATEEEARQTMARLEAGEAFDALAAELSTDSVSAAEGGDLGWFARGTMVAAFEEAAFSLEPGTISEPVASDYGYHIIEVLERELERPLEDDALVRFQDALLETWYSERTSAEDVVRAFSLNDVPDDPYAAG